jgi:hypothetical protein
MLSTIETSARRDSRRSIRRIYLHTKIFGASLTASKRAGLLVVLATLQLAGCSYFQSDVQRGYSENSHWKKSGAVNVSYTTADVRLVTERVHPVLGNSILCTEPSPDVAKALTTASQISANLGEATTSAQLGVAGGSAEAVDQLAGRTTALLALRDIVYRACEAYANGSLGANAYTVVIAKYGQLLSTLFLAQDMTGVVGPSGDSGAAGPPINFGSAFQPGASNANGSPGSPAPKGETKPTTGTSPTTGAPSTGGTPATAGSPSTGAATTAATPNTGGTPNATGSPSTAGSANPSGTPTSTGTPAAGNPPAGTPTAPPKSAGAPNSSGPPTNSEASAAIPSGAAVALVRMNEDFLDLDLNLPQLIFVACMNEFDQTRLQTTKSNVALTNPWLRPLCDKLNSFEALKTVAENYVDLAQKSGHPGAPVDPVSHASIASSNVSAASPSAISESKIILAAQKALKAANCYNATPTGKEDAATDAAATCFQVKQGLKQTATLDMETLVALKVIGTS